MARCETQRQWYDETSATFARHADRLGVVRVSKATRAAAGEGDDAELDDREVDLYSDASSITARSRASHRSGSASSKQSKQTAQTNKSRRRTEHKKHSLREGGPHEETALLEVLRCMVVQADAAMEPTSQLVATAIFLSERPAARALQEAAVRLQAVLAERRASIWALVLVPPPRGPGPAIVTDGVATSAVPAAGFLAGGGLPAASAASSAPDAILAMPLVMTGVQAVPPPAPQVSTAWSHSTLLL